jgi:hypothetical protein
MSPRGEQPSVPADVIEDSIIRFGQAIEECRQRWVDRWERAPRVRELVHSFEIVIAARAEDAVCDPDTFEAIWNPPRPPSSRSRYEPKDFTVSKPTQSHIEGCDLCRVTPSTGVSSPALQVLLEIEEETLWVDYGISDSSSARMTEAEARDVLLTLVVTPYLASRPGAAVHRVLLRPTEGLADPEELPWPPERRAPTPAP